MNRLILEKPFPVKGQGVVVYSTYRHYPFAITVQAKNEDNGISLDINYNYAMFCMKNGSHCRPLTMVTSGNCGLEKTSKVSYWYSYDRDLLVIKYGKGYRMEETTLMTYDFLRDAESAKDKANIRQQLYSYFNAETQFTVKLYYGPMVQLKGLTSTAVYDAEDELKNSSDKIAEDVYEVDPDVEFDRNPFVRNIPPLILDSSCVSLAILNKGDLCFSSSLPVACKELYENVKGCELNDTVKADTDKVAFSDAIKFSIKTEGCSLYKKLRKKAEIFGCGLQTTYLRVTLGQSYGNSPGIPYVLEIWPSKHQSPIHNHGNAHAVIKVLYGSIRVQIFNKHTKDIDATPLKEFDVRTGDLTWISRNWYQTHRLVNISDDFCATIQCYKYDENENTHWPYFDYVSSSSTIKRFLPDSDFEFHDLCRTVFEEIKLKHVRKVLSQTRISACDL